MHRVAASEATQQGAFGAALAAYQRALEADPTDVEAKAGLATTHIQLDQYKQAIVLYEQVPPQISTAHSGIPRLLALAYVGVGDETNAARVLQNAGTPQQRIAAEITALRAEIQRRRQ